MIVAGALRSRGRQTMLLGASTPTSRLSRYLQDVGPDAAAVRCSMAAGLPHARGFIEASRAAGIPVLAGGAAFGPDPCAPTGWAPPPGQPTRVRPPRLSTRCRRSWDVAREVAALQTGHDAIVDDALRQAGPGSGVDEDDPMRESLAQAVHAVTGAVLTSDGRLLAETSGWVSDMLRARSVPDPDPTVRAALVRALRDDPLAAAMLGRHWPDVIPPA